MSDKTLTLTWRNVQTRNIDPFSPTDSDNHNKLLKAVTNTDGHAYIRGLDLIEPYYNAGLSPDVQCFWINSGSTMTMTLSSGVVVMNYMVIDFTTTVSFALFTPSATLAGKTYYVVVEYTYAKTTPAPYAEVKTIVSTDYDSSKHVILYKFVFESVSPITDWSVMPSMADWLTYISASSHMEDMRCSTSLGYLPEWADRTFVYKVGDTMTGPLLLPGTTPTEDNEAVYKAWVEEQIMNQTRPTYVRVATTAEIPSFTTLATNVMDGVTLVDNDRVLVHNQSNPVQNGIMVYHTTSPNLSRADDADEVGELSYGMTVTVLQGTVNSGRVYTLSAPSETGPLTEEITPDTTPLSFVWSNGAPVDDLSLELTDNIHIKGITVGAGTAGRVLYTGATGLLQNANLVFTGSALGVGTASPTDTVHVNGTLRVGGTSTLIGTVSAGNIGCAALTASGAAIVAGNVTVGGVLLINGTTQTSGSFYRGNTPTSTDISIAFDGNFYATNVYNANYSDYAENFPLPTGANYEEYKYKLVSITPEGTIVLTQKGVNEFEVIGAVSPDYAFLCGKREDIGVTAAPVALAGQIWVEATPQAVYEGRIGWLAVPSEQPGAAGAIDPRSGEIKTGTVVGKIVDIDAANCRIRMLAMLR